MIERVGHAPRERVSWNNAEMYTFNQLAGHAPRERVSWNCYDKKKISNATVTLHVSVWVEICRLRGR